DDFEGPRDRAVLPFVVVLQHGLDDTPQSCLTGLTVVWRRWRPRWVRTFTALTLPAESTRARARAGRLNRSLRLRPRDDRSELYRGQKRRRAHRDSRRPCDRR